MSRNKVVVIIIVFLLAVGIGGALLIRSQPDLLNSLTRTDLVIRWTTESELDTVGFNLYRSDTADGEFVKINEELIPPAPDPFIGGEHTFIDENVIRGRTYYYQLETVTRHGGATIQGPFAIPADG